MIVAGFGTAEEHASATRPILERGDPLFYMIAPLPYVELQKMLDEAAPWGAAVYERAVETDAFTDDVIDVFVEHLGLKTSPMSLVPVFFLRGAYGRVADDATAYGGSRRARVAFNIDAACLDPAQLDAERAWVRTFWEALVPHASNTGGYVNFMAEYEEDRVRATYGPAKYERLARIKAEYDPDNVFHLNPNITPALQPA
jgi:hypothetical protein